jgi:hypothetical protein
MTDGNFYLLIFWISYFLFFHHNDLDSGQQQTVINTAVEFVCTDFLTDNNLN